MCSSANNFDQGCWAIGDVMAVPIEQVSEGQEVLFVGVRNDNDPTDGR